MAFARKDLGTTDWSPAGSGNGFAVGNPLALASIQEHWRAQSIAAGAVSSWLGRNSKFTLAQATGANQPVNTASQINGKAAVIFDGVNDSLDTGTSNMVIPEPWELWMLFKYISFISGAFAFEMGNTTLGSYGFFSAATNLRLQFGSTTYNMTTPAAGNWVLLRVSSGIGTNLSSVTLNNGASNTWGTPTVGTNTNGTQRLIAGSKADGTANSNIALADTFVTNAQLSAAEVTMVLNYYRNYYGLTL